MHPSDYGNLVHLDLLFHFLQKDGGPFDSGANSGYAQCVIQFRRGVWPIYFYARAWRHLYHFDFSVHFLDLPNNHVPKYKFGGSEQNARENRGAEHV